MDLIEQQVDTAFKKTIESTINEGFIAKLRHNVLIGMNPLTSDMRGTEETYHIAQWYLEEGIEEDRNKYQNSLWYCGYTNQSNNSHYHYFFTPFGEMYDPSQSENYSDANKYISYHQVRNGDKSMNALKQYGKSCYELIREDPNNEPIMVSDEYLILIFTALGTLNRLPEELSKKLGLSPSPDMRGTIQCVPSDSYPKGTINSMTVVQTILRNYVKFNPRCIKIGESYTKLKEIEDKHEYLTVQIETLEKREAMIKESEGRIAKENSEIYKLKQELMEKNKVAGDIQTLNKELSGLKSYKLDAKNFYYLRDKKMKELDRREKSIAHMEDNNASAKENSFRVKKMELENKRLAQQLESEKKENENLLWKIMELEQQLSQS